MRSLKNIFYSFPVQLVILHLKNHQILLLFWVVIFLTITNNFGQSYGIPYLLLSPEFLGKVNFLSFALLGFAFGAFWLTWNISTYILNSHRFPFLATLDRPFAMFSINNAIIPLGYLITYFTISIQFQMESEFNPPFQIMLNILGFLSGNGILMLLTGLYFQLMNQNIASMFGIKRLQKTKRSQKNRERGAVRSEDEEEDVNQNDQWRVDYFITSNLRIRHIRGVEHYEEHLVQSVLKQHHKNALIAELVSLGTLLSLGLLIDNPIFMIPTGATTFLLFSMLLVLSGAFFYWMGGWASATLILIILVIDVFVRYDLFSYNNKAYGLDYHTEPATYSYQHLQKMASPQNIKQDSQHVVQILERWKQRTGQQRPKLIIMSASGGGLSSALFSMRALQVADSITDGQLMQHTVLMSGASGGIFGTAYFRELYRLQQENKRKDIHDQKYAYRIARDMLNPVMTTLLVNDLFYPLQTFEKNGYTYRKDRGYILEKVYNQHTGYFLDKPLRAYHKPEEQAQIPMMLLTPTIINDERLLYISPHRHSYLMRSNPGSYSHKGMEIDGIDFRRMLDEQNALNLNFTSAIRMNGTYPYILPNVFLPTEPAVEAMDAGIRDNYGIETCVRFLNTFKTWIMRNTSGVILLQTRGYHDPNDISQHQTETIFSRMLNPVSNLYANWGQLQRFQQSYLVEYAGDWVEGSLHYIILEYSGGKKKQKTALSLHLTSKEKRAIMKSIALPENKKALSNLQQLLSNTGNKQVQLD